MNLNTAYLNGQFMPLSEAKISPLDRGFLFADAVYELLIVYEKQPFQLDAHYRRLQGSLQAIHLANAIEYATFKSIIAELIQNAPYSNSLVYLQITRGCDSSRNHFPPKQISPTVFAFIMPYEEQTIAQRSVGYHAMIENDIRWSRCDIKSTLLLPNILALMAGKEKTKDCIEVLLVKDGYLQEGASSAVFIEKADHLYTTPLTTAVLPSITRQVVIDIARLKRIPVHEEPIPIQRLFDADNLWLASTSKEISPVIRLNQKPIADEKPSPLWYTMIESYKTRTRE
ncbi:aminotransferase class IV [Legionella sp. W05-934-2]|jgi:D-alanine transaminase|uniref:aminotransferase class IV n=1 Tax=Legionella sp. W05-934-2 TaxID=1198649 RepID=UPI003462A67D